MPIKFSEEFLVSKEKLTELGCFDVILDIDTRVFLDPALLKLSTVKEFEGAREKVENYFSRIIVLLKHTKTENDMYWKQADKLLDFRELTGTCFGYSKDGTSGNAIGKVLRKNILLTIKELIEVGAEDPVIFELLGVFQENVGCDRVSDLITFILRNEIFSYTDRVVKALEIEYFIENYDNTVSYATCLNKYNNKPLLLLPEELLSPLPVAYSFDDIDFVCAKNQQVRDTINQYFDLNGKKKLKKNEIKSCIKQSSEFRSTLIDVYRGYDVEKYDFIADPYGEYIWLEAAQKYVKDYPLKISSTAINDMESAINITQIICEKFKDLIETNGLNDLLYDENKKPKHERAAQLLFFGVSDSYCSANNIDLTRESNSGRGPVDFKLSKGAVDKIVVEIKLTSNPQLKHGIEKQLPIYMKQEQTVKAIYLIIDNGNAKSLENFYRFYNDLDTKLKSKIDVIVIDGTYKVSASKA